MIPFSPDSEMQKLPVELTQEFVEHVLYDEEPLFISDEATIWDVSMNSAEEIIKRCSEYYGKPVSEADLKQPLWKLIRQLNNKKLTDRRDGR